MTPKIIKSTIPLK
jgi:hypothetical protein